MINEYSNMVSHKVSNRLLPHLGISDVIADGGFLQLSHGGNGPTNVQRYLRYTSRAFNEKELNLSPTITATANGKVHYYPKDKIIFRTNGANITAVNAKNGLTIWTVNLGTSINSVFWLSCNRITKKLHIRTLTTSSTYKTYTVDIKTGGNLNELTGNLVNCWGVFDYKNNVFYNTGSFTTLNKVNGTTGETIVSVSGSGFALRIANNSKIEIDNFGHVLIWTVSSGTLVITLLDTNLNVLCYSNVSYPTDLKSVTLDKDGSGDYYYATVSVINNINIQQVEVWKYKKSTGGIKVDSSVYKLYNEIKNSNIDVGVTISVVTSFTLKDALFIGISSFNGSIIRSPFWFLVNKGNLEIAANPLNWTATSKYNATDYLPYYGMVGE